MMNAVGSMAGAGATVLPTADRPEGMTAHDFAYDYLRRAVLEMVVPPKAILTEQLVSDAISVSRTPVREVFLRLAAEGLLEIIPRRGAYVVPITYRQIREIAETREMFEKHAARLILERGIRVADTLWPLVEAQRKLTLEHPDNVIEIVEVDRRFHLAMIQAIGNTEFFSTYAQLHERQLRTGISMFRKFPDRKSTALEHHHEIAEAFERADVERVTGLIHDHLVGSLEGIDVYFRD